MKGMDSFEQQDHETSNVNDKATLKVKKLQ
jgi:hypothetical protein